VLSGTSTVSGMLKQTAALWLGVTAIVQKKPLISFKDSYFRQENNAYYYLFPTTEESFQQGNDMLQCGFP